MDASDELEQLLNAVVPFARDMLEKYDAFLPFGAAVGLDGEVRMVAAELSGEHPAAAEVVQTLQEGLLAQAREHSIRAAGVCTDVRIDGEDGPVDAVSVSLEHVEHDPLRVFVPYTVDDEGTREYGKPVGAPGERLIFV